MKKISISYQPGKGFTIEREGEEHLTAKQKTLITVTVLLVLVIAAIAFTLIKLVQLVGSGVLIGFLFLIILIALVACARHILP